MLCVLSPDHVNLLVKSGGMKWIDLILNMGCKFIDDNAIATSLKLNINADDTVLLCGIIQGLTEILTRLNAMLTYFDDWDLTIDTNKTKVMIISRGTIKKKTYN